MEGGSIAMEDGSFEVYSGDPAQVAASPSVPTVFSVVGEGEESMGGRQSAIEDLKKVHSRELKFAEDLHLKTLREIRENYRELLRTLEERHQAELSRAKASRGDEVARLEATIDKLIAKVGPPD